MDALPAMPRSTRSMRLRVRNFSSGKTIAEFTHFLGLAISGGRVYVTTYQSNVYAFGLKK